MAREFYPCAATPEKHGFGNWSKHHDEEDAASDISVPIVGPASTHPPTSSTTTLFLPPESWGFLGAASKKHYYLVNGWPDAPFTGAANQGTLADRPCSVYELFVRDMTSRLPPGPLGEMAKFRAAEWADAHPDIKYTYEDEVQQLARLHGGSQSKKPRKMKKEKISEKQKLKDISQIAAVRCAPSSILMTSMRQK